MRLLVTGGCGFLGTNVCLEALKRGHEVIAFDNFVRPRVEENALVLQAEGVTVVRGDVRNRIDLDKLPYPDAIIHLAGPNGMTYGQFSPYYDFEINVLGSINILEYARRGNIPVSLASTNKVYTKVNTVPMQETETRFTWDIKGVSESFDIDGAPHTFYGTSKVSADLYFQEYHDVFGLPTIVNRMSSIYGLYQKGNEEQGWVSWFINQIANEGNINIFGTGKQVRDMLFGTDCAKLYLDQIEQGVTGVFNVGGGEFNMSLLEAIAEIEKVTGKKAKLTFCPEGIGKQNIYISDLTKITSTIDWKPTISPQEGIKLIYEESLNK